MPTIDDLKSIYGIYKEQIEIVHTRLSWHILGKPRKKT